MLAYAECGKLQKRRPTPNCVLAIDSTERIEACDAWRTLRQAMNFGGRTLAVQGYVPRLRTDAPAPLSPATVRVEKATDGPHHLMRPVRARSEGYACLLCLGLHTFDRRHALLDRAQPLQVEL